MLIKFVVAALADYVSGLEADAPLVVRSRAELIVLVLVVYKAAESLFRSQPVAFGAGLSDVSIVGHSRHAIIDRITLLIGAVVIRSHPCDVRGEGVSGRALPKPH
jgi:hypothetical protein